MLVLAALGALGVGTLYSTGSSDLSGQEAQPVAFTHVKHAGDLGIECLYCHRAAADSPTAGIPSMYICIGCHRNLADETSETRKLLASWSAQTPVEWTRLHRLPDFVYFTHEMHLANGLQCQQCHGHVERMAAPPRAESHEMGWCLSCHEARGASRDCWTCHK